MLRIEEASKAYKHRGRDVIAMSRVSLNIEKGDFICIVGPSGSGKSTFLLTLGGMLSPSEGRVLLEGRSLYDLPANDRARIRRERMGFVFQTFNLIPYLSAIENVEVPLLLNRETEEEQTSRAESLLRKVRLGDRLDHKPPELSVGQQQRVALARMLANDPEVILADEPTGNLDPATGQQIIEFLAELNLEGKTVVMVTHDQRAAVKAKKVLWLYEGRLSAEERKGARPFDQ
ncbi:MAG: ABC transporter ATP-binding protein [bacterium]